jgi:DNA-nicking Smr family endonuclease
MARSRDPDRPDRRGAGSPPPPAGPARPGAPYAVPDELDLFRAAVRDVRPLAPRPAPPDPPRPPARAQFRRADEAAVLAESLELGPGEFLVETGDELLFRRAGIAARTLERLRRGEYAVEDEIDLHGLIATEAREVLREFLADALKHRRHCVRVIHGKGLRSGPRGPVLKHAVNTWLRKTEAVLAFASARQVDGGTGAVYVLLAR